MTHSTKKLIKRSCSTCEYSSGKYCKRDFREPAYTQRYERSYTDDDFCGPSLRYWTRRLSYLQLRYLQGLIAALKAQGPNT